MKLIMMMSLVLFSCTALGAHPASVALTHILDEGARALDRTGSAKKRALCQFVKRRVDARSMGMRWLGNYADSGDPSGVRAFLTFIPSLIVTKAYPKLNDVNGDSGTYSVSPNATQRANGDFSVSVEILTDDGDRYNGRIILSPSHKIRDVEYLGMSGVNYIGRDFKRELDSYARSSSKPVTEFVRKNSAASGFIRCD